MYKLAGHLDWLEVNNYLKFLSGNLKFKMRILRRIFGPKRDESGEGSTVRIFRVTIGVEDKKKMEDNNHQKNFKKIKKLERN